MKIENSFLEGACRSFPYFPDKCDRHLARQEEMIYADLIFIIDYSKLGEGGNFRMHCKYYQLMVNILFREMNID